MEVGAVEETGPVERRLRVEIPTAEVDAAFDAVYRRLQRGARIRGFRPGKVPRSVLERYFGEQAGGEVLEQLVRESLPRAVESAALEPIAEPRLKPEGTPRQGAAFAYEATLEVRPEIELAEVRGLEVRTPELPEPEEDPVERHLAELRTSQAPLAEEPPGTAAARGHLAVIDFDATVDGEPFRGSSGREQVLELGAGAGVPGLDEQIEGMEPGAEREFDLELPDSFPVEEVAGKTAHFRVRLVELKRRELPELDDEFAKDVSDFDTLEELRADLRRRVEEGREQERKRLIREAVIDALLEANPFPVPQGLVDRQLESRLARAAQQLERMPRAELGRLLERWREEWRPDAERDVRLALIVPEIVRAEGLEVSDEDVDERLRELAEQQGQSLSALKRQYRERGLLDALQSSLLEERAVEFLVSAATLSDA